MVYSGTGGGTVNYTAYDGNANLLALNENGANGITRTYDGLNRVTSYTFAGQTIGYRYYPSGKLANLIYPGGTETGVGHVEYTYNADGRLYQVIDKLDSTSSPRTTTYSWNTDGRLQSITRPNGTTRTISYDSAGRPNGITESYSYDSRNRLTGMGVTAYTYNAENNRIGITSPTETTTLVVDPEGALPKILMRTKNGAGQPATFTGPVCNTR
ncbi:MAG: RHS repeat domain-containing protein [Terrimicrobiaceae bacterium]